MSSPRPDTFNVVVRLRGYATTDGIVERVRACLETHPTLSLRVDDVRALVEISPDTDAIEVSSGKTPDSAYGS